MADAASHPELARPYFTRQAQYGRRVVFAWRPADTSPHNPLTTPWPNADEAAARRFDPDGAVGASGRPPGGDVAHAGPWVEFFTWEEAERWLREGLP